MKKVCLFIFICGFISYTYSQNVIKSLDSNKVEIIDQNAKMALDSNKILWEQTLVKSETSTDSVFCNVQWAGLVIKFSSEFSKIEKSATMIVGKPNAMPVGGDSPLAWAVKDKAGRETPGEAFIRVGYVAPMRIQQVAIAESFNPGSITKVVIYGVGGEELKIYEGSPLAYKNTTRMFAIFLDKPTDFYVKEIEITMNPEAVPGWNMIDAVGVSDCKDSIRAKINLIPNLHFDSKPENLGSSINSIYDETAPFISPDGKSLLIVRKFHPENAGGFQDKDDIWWSKLDDNGKWTPAKNIGQPLNNKFSNFVQSITPDGNSLLLGNAYNKDGTMTDGVSFTYRTREGWAFPEKQMIDGFYNLSQYANYFLSNDGRQLLMAVEMKDSYGGLDLYISFRRGDNRWSKPLNLGPGINTAFNDYSPFLAADGVTLYYSTSGLAGYGKEDIFVTQRQDDSWINWTEPQNMGPVINSAQSDSKYNLPASGEFAYYSSEINTANKSDIYRIALPKQVKPKAVVLISGKVINEKTNEPVDARIIVEELPDGTEVAIARTNPNTGEFKIILPAGKKYGFRAIGLGYFETNKNIDLTEINEYQEIEDEFMRLAPIEIGQVVRLNNIFFDFAKATLKEESFPELDRTVEFMKNNPKLEIEIAGHTDNISTDEYNQKLSQARAESVANYIISKGITSTRVTAVGYGESRPIAFNNDDEGRAQNRRVEFKVLKL